MTDAQQHFLDPLPRSIVYFVRAATPKELIWGSYVIKMKLIKTWICFSLPLNEMFLLIN